MRHGEITFEWGDGEHTFRLALGQLRELEDKRVGGFRKVQRRIAEDRWYVDDIREVVRLGLIGGGKTPIEALALVKRYVDDRPLGENVIPAVRILHAALFGPEEDQPLGKAEAAEQPTSASASPPSTETLQ